MGIADGEKDDPIASRTLVRLATGIASIAFLLAGRFPVHSADAFGHLAQGRQIAQLGHVPSHDSFSIFRDTPQVWRNYEWLSDLLGYRIYAALGVNGLIVVKCMLLVVTATLLVTLAARLAGARAALLSCVLFVLALIAMRFRFTERPHVIGYLGLALYALGATELWRASGASVVRWTALLAVVHVAWVNMHGSHLLGLSLLGTCLLFSLGDAQLRKRFTIVVVLQLAASCISPYGPWIVVDAVEHVLRPEYRALVSEWQPWQPTDSLWLLLLPVSATLLLVALLAPIARSHPAARALVSVALLLALATSRSLRFVADFLLLAVPLLGVGLASWSVRLSLRALTTSAAVALVVLAGLLPRVLADLPPHLDMGLGQNSVRLPVGAGRWLAQHARAPRVLASMEDAWYLMFAAPDARFVLDGRVPFYGAEHVRSVHRAFGHPGELARLIDRHAVDTVIVRHAYEKHRVLLDAMRATSGFVLVDVEDRTATFVSEQIALCDDAALQPIELEPSYEPAWLLTASAERRAAILTELTKLPDDEAHAGYRSFVHALFALSSLLRPGGHDGFRDDLTPEELRTLRRALPWLRRASRGGDGVPLLDAYVGLSSIALCELDSAERALDAAAHERESRETIMGRQELRLRHGDVDSVRAFLADADRDARAKTDPWLRALHGAVAAPRRCE